MLLFEDNITKFPYKLLHATRVDIQGSCGGTKLPKMLKSLSEPTICFVDVTPDNSRTLALYEQCVANANTRTTVVPIPCIEYLFARAFIGYADAVFNTLLTFGNYKQFPQYVNGRALNVHNYENFCKTAVAACKPCYRNGRFQEVSCLCEFLHEFESCTPASLASKSRRLSYALPGAGVDAAIAKAQGISIFNTMARRFAELGVTSNLVHL